LNPRPETIASPAGSSPSGSPEPINRSSQLWESRIYLRGLFEASPDAVFIVDRSLRITDVNEEMVRLTGYTRRRLLGSRFPVLLDNPAAGEEAVLTALERGRITNYEMVLVDRHGRHIPIAFNAGTFFDLHGEILGVLATARDITVQKTTEAHLQESEIYNRILIESTTDALMATDLLGVITDVNRQMEALVDRPRELIKGRNMKDFFTDPAQVEEIVRRVLVEGRVSDVELTVHSDVGVTVDLSCNATTYRDAQGRLKGVLAAVHDITGQKHLRDELRRRNLELQGQSEAAQEASRLKSEFIAAMSHELRTPLNSIIGFADAMLGEDDPSLTTEQREYLGYILSGGNHLLELINELLDLSKVESGKIALTPEIFAPADMIAEVAASLRPQLAEKHLQLRTDVEGGLDRVVLDPRRFKQILYNLLSNAVKFTNPTGIITISLRRVSPNRFALEVSDTGIGIAPEDLPRLFRAFEQLEVGTSRRYSGSGLGLALTRGLVELQQGTIEVTSEIGHGSTFRVELPRMLRAGGSRGDPAAGGR
jgi:PAS domain S-box-containing protein